VEAVVLIEAGATEAVEEEDVNGFREGFLTLTLTPIVGEQEEFR